MVGVKWSCCEKVNESDRRCPQSLGEKKAAKEKCERKKKAAKEKCERKKKAAKEKWERERPAREAFGAKVCFFLF